jgi:rubrerythrin
MSTEQDKTLSALQAAIKMETDGKQFYLKAGEASRNEVGKKLLVKLAEEEDIHRTVFEKIYENVRQQQGWPKADIQADGGQGLRTVFARALESMDAGAETIPEEIDAVQTAMKMENETYDFYKDRASDARDAEKGFYEALAAQESEHHRVLLDYYEFLKDPAAWFVQKEHHSLDGS